MDDLSVSPYVRVSLCPAHCGKTADQIRMPFGIIGWMGPGMRQVVGIGDRSTGRGTFGDEIGGHHCNQWGLYGVGVRRCLNHRSCGLGWCVRWTRYRYRSCIRWGPRQARGREGFGGFCSPF